VNVGCIPKKLMHISSTLGEVNANDSASLGWNSSAAPVHSWEAMTGNIQGYIKDSLNQGLIDAFEANGIDYHNAYATLADKHTITLTDKDGNVTTKTAKYILLAAGGRPSMGKTPGTERCVSSDDLFWLPENPGKTLIVGAAYIALECGGFLTGIGCDVTVMVRSILLRGFDRECVAKIGNYMEAHNTSFKHECTPTSFVDGKDKKVGCHFKSGDGVEGYEEYDTVLMAIGRTGEADKLGLANAGLWCNGKGKVEASCERTNVPNIFCIGDLVANRIELTPVAKVAGKKIIARLFKGDKMAAMDYSKIATTVFTPLEYGMVGLSQDQAEEKYGKDGLLLQILSKSGTPLEWTLTPSRKSNEANKAFFKVLIDNGSTPPGKIVGFHYLGPNAGEILQGMAVAIKAGATKEHLEDTIGIHPTTAETMTMLGGVPIKGIKCES